jgi:hypothetical protein
MAGDMMKILSRLLAIEHAEEEEVRDSKKKLPAAFQKRNHRKMTCNDCKQSYYYDVVKCPICSSGRLVVEMIGGVIR